MNKLVKVLAATAMAATVLVGCKKDEPVAETAKYAKAGLGVVSSYNKESGQVNTTFVGLGLDADGKIQYIDLDVAQSTPGVEGKEYDKTKQERGTDYGMKDSSPIKKEWDEQAKAFQDFCKGKTPEEVAAVETQEGAHGGKAAKEGTDLAAGCTIGIDDFLAAVDKAAKNAVDAKADKIVLGRVMKNDATKGQLNTTLALVATDAEGKIVYNKLDVAQIYDGRTETKGEIKEGYAMKEKSPIGKEWYEQAKAWEDYFTGKTLDDVKNLPVEEGKTTDADLKAGCTISVGDFVEAYNKAK